jgi:16S rRNA C1402 N4-methylase RsmH
MRPSLTELAHLAIAARLRPGARAIDATVGNGHDILFLAEHVGPSGRVYGFDVQPAAIAATRTRLRRAGLEQRSRLLLAGHERMLPLLPKTLQGRIMAITFNLGYLPRSDKRVRTRSATTLAALQQALSLLADDGLLSVIAYRGHAGGEEETAAVERWLQQQPGQLQKHASPGPLLFLYHH